MDLNIRLGDVLMVASFLAGGWRFAFVIRDEMRGLRQTVYGSIEPPVEGLVKVVQRHDDCLIEHGLDRRAGSPKDRRH